MLLLSLAMAEIPYLAPRDPGPHMWRSALKARQLECYRTSAQAGYARYPGTIETSGARGDAFERDAVICQEWIVQRGSRDPLQEAVLSTLEERASEFASATDALRPDLHERTWLVETYFPDQAVAAKISFATKNALVAHGLRVSDRTPTLAFGDVNVLSRMNPSQAYPAVCKRYHANGSLKHTDALLAIVTRDRRDTNLHMGLCTEGVWTWLR